MCIYGAPITQNGLPQETTQLLKEPPFVFVQAMQQLIFMGPVYVHMHAAGQA